MGAVQTPELAKPPELSPVPELDGKREGGTRLVRVSRATGGSKFMCKGQRGQEPRETPYFIREAGAQSEPRDSSNRQNRRAQGSDGGVGNQTESGPCAQKT